MNFHQKKRIIEVASKNRGDESIRVIIHIYMEMSQGNSLCSYLKQTKMSFFFIYKIIEQEGGTGPGLGVRVVPVGGEGRGEMVKEGKCGANSVYTCM
jgi:hypothetical protein